MNYNKKFFIIYYFFSLTIQSYISVTIVYNYSISFLNFSYYFFSVFKVSYNNFKTSWFSLFGDFCMYTYTIFCLFSFTDLSLFGVYNS